MTTGKNWYYPQPTGHNVTLYSSHTDLGQLIESWIHICKMRITGYRINTSGTINGLPTPVQLYNPTMLIQSSETENITQKHQSCERYWIIF